MQNFDPTETHEPREPTIVVPESASYPYDDSVMTQKELLLELRRDVRAMAKTLDIMAAQELHTRVSDLEKWRQRADGRIDTIVRGVPFLSGVIGLVSAALAVLAVITLGA